MQRIQKKKKKVEDYEQVVNRKKLSVIYITFENEYKGPKYV